MATLEPIALYDVDERELRSLSRDEEHYQMLTALGIRSAMWVPLIVRDKVVGVLSAAIAMPSAGIRRQTSTFCASWPAGLRSRSTTPSCIEPSGAERHVKRPLPPWARTRSPGCPTRSWPSRQQISSPKS